ncbi:hypothetical protein KY290_022273 [Solanum tuberosum]|uniref:Uncharacterized protein n=1 Tax=Solanum tuberosum TaxID=4113 RepID=A0ABQ7V3W2_SOLTU|nr:hypothetical protein KY289_021402 [Solanum tuberosum]KAH0758780.1 hypothetical protein KY290_022273 [Solanum tuberosum]
MESEPTNSPLHIYQRTSLKPNEYLVKQHNDGQTYSLEEEEEEEDIVTFAGGRKMSRKHRKEYITRAIGPVVPLRGDYHKPTCIELSRMAIDKFNNENAQNYEFVEILNMNGQKEGGFGIISHLMPRML